jgi:hypothetical protein
VRHCFQDGFPRHRRGAPEERCDNSVPRAAAQSAAQPAADDCMTAVQPSFAARRSAESRNDSSSRHPPGSHSPVRPAPAHQTAPSPMPRPAIAPPLRTKSARPPVVGQMMSAAKQGQRACG